jgi:L-histidine N-alpha-methyltransferase
MTSARSTITMTELLKADDIHRALRRDVRHGLTQRPRTLPPKWFYDGTGSLLFEQITRLPEYYPTEAERAALRNHTDEIVALAQADTLVELGSGASDKTTELLDAMARTGELQRYVPFDVSEAALREAAQTIVSRYPGIGVDAIVGDFDAHLLEIPRHGRRLLAFLGGTIGNYTPVDRTPLLHTISTLLRAGETFLLGVDLVKDPQRLVRAYDDSSGVTAAFNLNVLAVINRELDADFDLDDFIHVALWDEHNEWIEMRHRAGGGA